MMRCYYYIVIIRLVVTRFSDSFSPVTLAFSTVVQHSIAKQQSARREIIIKTSICLTTEQAAST